MTDQPGSAPDDAATAAPAAPVTTPGTLTFHCSQCGARLEYAPGTTSLKCPYCGHLQAVAAIDTVIEEHSFDAWAAVPPKPRAAVGSYRLVCHRCGAQTDSDNLSDTCPFCAAPIVAETAGDDQIAPEAVVPFGIDQRAAQDAVKTWVRSRWFAPNKLKKVGATEQLHGTYMPHWTFDAETATDYSGMRGEHYWETETYTENGETRTRQVMRTAWYPAAGHVERFFDDVVVPGSTRLPPDRIDDLAPWPLENAKPYQPDYLSGYRTLRYDLEPDQGLSGAKQRMENVIEGDCRDDIGGDEQRVSSMDVHYAQVMFKLVLLPIWIAAYLYAGKTYQVFVNAHTGEVVGERPYSVPKIAAAVVAALIVLGIVVTLYIRTKNGG
jgi:Zn finger protein HypA/HybF involved in hydrogenase expression